MRSLAPPKCILGRGVQLINPNFIQKFQIFDNLGVTLCLSWKGHRGGLGIPAHTIIAQNAKLLSRGLRPICGGGVRNNRNTICTSIVLWMITMMTIVLARVLRSTYSWMRLYVHEPMVTHSHCIHTHHDTNTTNIVIRRVSHVCPYTM